MTCSENGVPPLSTPTCGASIGGTAVPGSSPTPYLSDSSLLPNPNNEPPKHSCCSRGVPRKSSEAAAAQSARPICCSPSSRLPIVNLPSTTAFHCDAFSPSFGGCGCGCGEGAPCCCSTVTLRLSAYDPALNPDEFFELCRCDCEDCACNSPEQLQKVRALLWAGVACVDRATSQPSVSDGHCVRL